jgi:hypothetical protein
MAVAIFLPFAHGSCIYMVMPCGDDCPFGLPCSFGIPLVIACCCCCEREGNAGVNRDKSGMKTGEAVLVDKETGTLACYLTSQSGVGGSTRSLHSMPRSCAADLLFAKLRACLAFSGDE